MGTFEGTELRLRNWKSPRDDAQKTKGREGLVLPALPDPRTPIPYLCGLPAQGQPLSYWAGTFLSADEVRQGWPLTDLNPQCTPVLSQAQLGSCL